MIFYFSATGNSEWAAQTLAEQTHDRIVSITDAMQNEEFSYALHSGEHLGFVFPVHGWRVPMIVRHFIAKLRLSNYNTTTYTYSLVTCGDSVGETLTLLKEHLAVSKIHLNASFSLIMPESYIGLPFMYLDNKDREQKKYSRSKARIQKYSELICESRGGEHLDKGAFPRLYSGFLGRFFYNHLVTDKHFHVDKKACIGCSQCARVCPVGDIKCEQGSFPEWIHNEKCLTCYACLHHCPVNAISWGWFTKGKGQYFYGK